MFEAFALVALILAAALAASRALDTLLFGVEPLDPLTYAAVTGLLAVVAVTACCAPAWRAPRINPTISLRS